MALPYKCVLMVGATSGIGLGMAEKLISKGSKVVVVGRRKDRLDEFVRKHGKTKAGAVPFDITNTKGMSSFVDTVTSNYPDLDCLFLNAGTQGVHDFSKPEKVDLTAFHEEMNVNFASYVNISAAFLPFLQSKPSATSIVITGSHLAIVPAFNMPAYSASKTALNVYTLCLRDQLAHAGSKVKVIEICGPPVQTELHDYMGEDKGRAFGMPLENFCDQVYGQLETGTDEILIGGIGPPEKFKDLVKQRRETFDMLGKLVRSHS